MQVLRNHLADRLAYQFQNQEAEVSLLQGESTAQQRFPLFKRSSLPSTFCPQRLRGEAKMPTDFDSLSDEGTDDLNLLYPPFQLHSIWAMEKQAPGIFDCH